MMINVDIITLIFLITLVVSVLLVVMTNKLINAVIYMGAFSLLSALVFLLLGAPDVALAEAIIGSTLSTIIYLIAIKKFKIFTVYHINNSKLDKERDEYLNAVIRDMSAYLKSKEMQMHLVHTNLKLDHLIQRDEQGFIIENSDDGIIIHSNKVSYHNQKVKGIIDGYNFPVKIEIKRDIIDQEMPYSEGGLDNEKI